MLHILNDNIGDIQGDMEFVTSYGDSIENTDETVKVIDTKVKDIVASVDGIKNDTLEIIDTVTTMNTTLGNVTMMETLTGDAIVSNKYEEDIFSVGYSGIRHVSLTMNVLGLDQTNPRDDVSIGMLFDIHPGALDVVTMNGVWTYEFDTDNWYLVVSDHGGEPVRVWYQATITYPSNQE